MDAATLDALNYALPGLVMAWIYYGLTAHPKAHNLERVVQALVFTALIFFVVSLIKWSAISLGKLSGSVGSWTSEVERVWAFFCACILGVIFAVASNSDRFHRFLRQLGITKNSGFPSVWFQSLYCRVSYVTLHLEGERRLMGWIKMWPSKCEDGHFEIVCPAWLDSDDEGNVSRVELPQVEAIMISAKSVIWIEYLSDKIGEEKSDGSTPNNTVASPSAGEKQ